MKDPIRKFRKFFVKPKKMNATAVRNAAASSYDEEVDDTKLSGAFIIVLILHIVAVVGIVAFTKFRENRKGIEAAATVAPVKEKKATPTSPMTIPAAAPKAAQLAPEAPVAETPAVIENNPPRTLPSTGSQIHTVKQGETLTKIAMAYGTTVQELARVNTLKSTKEIAVGQVLNIPDKNSMPPQPTVTERKTESVKTMPPKVTQPVTAKTPVAPVAAATTSYVVKKGDSPLKIAREHNITYDELAKVNKKMNPANLQPGQTLLIPRKK